MSTRRACFGGDGRTTCITWSSRGMGGVSNLLMAATNMDRVMSVWTAREDECTHIADAVSRVAVAARLPSAASCTEAPRRRETRSCSVVPAARDCRCSCSCPSTVFVPETTNKPFYPLTTLHRKQVYLDPMIVALWNQNYLFLTELLFVKQIFV